MSLLGTLLLSKVRRHGVPSDPFHVTLLKNYFVISIKSLINNSLVKCVCVWRWWGGTIAGTRILVRRPYKATRLRSKDNRAVSGEKCKINLIKLSL